MNVRKLAKKQISEIHIHISENIYMLAMITGMSLFILFLEYLTLFQARRTGLYGMVGVAKNREQIVHRFKTL